MSTKVETPPLVSQYEMIKRIRAFEDKSISLFQDGIVPGFTHAYSGQEAVAVGVCSVLEPGDRVGSNHRGHGHILARGADSSKMLAEILGKRDGYLQGMGGELHIMDASINIIGANGIVGAGIPIAVGAALSDRLQGNDNVTVSFFGDGATSEGYFSRGRQPRFGLGPPGRLHLREQPLRRVHRCERRRRGRDLQAGRGLRHPGRARRRPGRGRRRRGGPDGRGPGARGRGARRSSRP